MNRKKRTCCHVIPERRRTGRPVKSRKTFEINWNCNTRTRHHHRHHTAPMGSGGTAFKHAQSTSTRSRSFIPPPLKRGCRWRWQRRWNIKSYFMFLNPKNTQRTNCFYGRHVYAVVVHSPSICRNSLYLKVYDGCFSVFDLQKFLPVPTVSNGWGAVITAAVVVMLLSQCCTGLFSREFLSIEKKVTTVWLNIKKILWLFCFYYIKIYTSFDRMVDVLKVTESNVDIGS